MKKVRLDIIILALATILVLFFVLKDDFNDIVKILLNINVLYIIIAVLLYAVSDAFKAIGLYVTVKPFNMSYKFKYAYKLNLVSDFLNGVTPFCAGGGPYQVYYLSKNHNISYAKGTSIVFQNFFMRQIALVIICSIAILINEIHTFIPLDSFLKHLVLLGHLVNIIIAIVLLLINIDRRGKKSLIKSIIKFLLKIKLIKEKTFDKAISYMDNFYETQVYIRKQKHVQLKVFISYFVSLTLMFLVPIMVFNAIDVSVHLPIFSYIIPIIYVYILGGFVPIPGGTTGYEFGFITFFGFFLGGPILKAGMLLWRVVTYYFLVIIGAIVFLIDRKE